MEQAQTDTRQIRVHKRTRSLLRVLKKDDETWPEVVDRVLSGDVSEEEVRAARTLAESASEADDASGGA